MRRRFCTSTRRDQQFLDDIWDLKLDAQDSGVQQEWYTTFPQDATEVWVPGVWNTCSPFEDYEGVAWYRTRFVAQGLTMIHFGSVTQQANVWLDSEPLGDHYGGWLPFAFGPFDLDAGEHELVVRVDSTHDMRTTIPSANWNGRHYGGITRSVLVESLHGQGHVASLRLTSLVEEGRATLRVRAELANLRRSPLQDEWRLYCGDQLLRSGRVSLASEETQVLLFAVELMEARLWSPEEPALYAIRLEFAGDDLIERTGFREIRVEGRDVLLNGQTLRVLATNWCKDHPDGGPLLPVHLLLSDLSKVADLVINAIGGGYPHDPQMLDLCDERGILVLEGLPLWGYSREQLALELIVDRASAMAWAMVERDVGHPCVWAWSVLDTCATDTREGRSVVERLVDTIRETDPTRPVTLVSSRGTQDICFDLVDIISVNAEPGWGEHYPDWPDLAGLRQVIAAKPLLICGLGAEVTRSQGGDEPGELDGQECQRENVAQGLKELLDQNELLGFFLG